LIPLVLELLDRVAVRHGIEYRFPFCDRELVEFCLAIPTDLQLRAGYSRWILRKAMSRRLPEKICWRDGKTDLSDVYEHGLQRFDASVLEGLTRDMPPRLDRFVNTEACRRVSGRFRLGHARREDFRILWQCSVLDGWLQRNGGDQRSID
jgi:asparagine synthase (glutamine-hydrolysing)